MLVDDALIFLRPCSSIEEVLKSKHQNMFVGMHVISLKGGGRMPNH